MRPMTRRALPAAAAALVLAVSACGSSDDSSHGSMPAGGGTSASTSAGTATGVEADVTFAQMMIPHHEQAVEIPRPGERRGIRGRQGPRRSDQGRAGPRDPDHEGMAGQWRAQQSTGPMDHGSGGMMSDQDMTSLMVPAALSSTRCGSR